MKIAFLGLGNMGAPMARNLVKAGHEVTVWNRTPLRTKEVPGAECARTPAEAARGAEVAFTMLANDEAVESVVFGSDGVIAGLATGAIHVSSSTISVDLANRMNEAHSAKQQVLVAAPVFGRPAAADAAKLYIAAAGPAEAIAKCDPLFSAIGQKHAVIGDHPSASVILKISGNFMIATIIESLGEAIALTRKYGVDTRVFVDFITSSLFNAPIFITYSELIANEQFTPAGFKLRLGLKDIRLAVTAADQNEVPLPLGSLIHDKMLSGVANGMGDLDWSSLALIAAENAGLKKT